MHVGIFRQQAVQDQHQPLQIGAAVLWDVAENNSPAVVIEKMLEEVLKLLHLGGQRLVAATESVGLTTLVLKNNKKHAYSGTSDKGPSEKRTQQ